MIKIEVTDVVRRVNWTDKKTGERQHFDVQEAWAHIPGDKYPTKIEISPERGNAPYKPGVYALDPNSVCIVTDQFGKSKLGLKPKLLTQSAAAARAPTAA